MTETASLLYITTANQAEARGIAAALLEERLIACANILPGMTSLYRWAGEVKGDTECVLILKTRTALVPQVTERVIALHSYDCPCVVALPADDGNPDFLRWIADETSQSS